MAFQPAAGLWHLLDGPPEDHTLSDTRAAIARHVRANPNSTPKAIADATGLSHENVRKTCQRMNADGQLCVNATGHYRLPGTESPGAVPGVPTVPDHATTSTNARHHEGQPALLPVPAVPADEETHQ
jgi:biotin operon repressor